MRYVALLRGIGPSNPNMHGSKLKGFFESLGFKNVSPVISSGNVVFDSPSRNTRALEANIEKELPTRLGFKSTTIIRSKAELESIERKDPFKKVRANPHFYLFVTFLKEHHSSLRTFPRKGKGYAIAGATRRELFTYLHLKKGGHTPDYMRVLEKEFGKGITSRTWLTIGRILKKMRG